MSTGSAASDAEEDYEPCHSDRRSSGAHAALERSARRKNTNSCYDVDAERYSDEDLEEEDDHGRKLPKGRLKDTPPRHAQRNAANARERARMRVLSKAFTRLKTSLPWVPADTKLSKLDTLRLASSYISHLRQLLQDDRFENRFAHPVNLTWPFMMTGRPEDSQDMLSTVRLCGATA